MSMAVNRVPKSSPSRSLFAAHRLPARMAAFAVALALRLPAPFLGLMGAAAVGSSVAACAPISPDTFDGDLRQGTALADIPISITPQTREGSPQPAGEGIEVTVSEIPGNMMALKIRAEALLLAIEGPKNLLDRSFVLKFILTNADGKTIPGLQDTLHPDAPVLPTSVVSWRLKDNENLAKPAIAEPQPAQPLPLEIPVPPAFFANAGFNAALDLTLNLDVSGLTAPNFSLAGTISVVLREIN